MMMKRSCSFLLCIALLLILSACQPGQSNKKAIIPQPYYTSFANSNYAVFNGGVIYRKNLDDYLHVLDFSTGRANIFCSRPNCLHNDSTCNAYAEEDLQSFFAAGNKLYYLMALDPELDPEINAYRQKCDLMVSDLNRENEQKIGSIDGGNHLFQIYFWENTAYLFILDSPIAGTGEYLETLYLVELDLQKNKLVQPVKISENYSNSVANIAGVYEGELYFESNFLNQPLSDSKDVLFESAYWRYDLKSRKLNQVESSFPDNAPEGTGTVLAITNGFCLVNQNDSLRVLDLSSGEETSLCEKGDFLFSYDGSFYYAKEETEETPNHYRFSTSSGEVETVYGSKENFPVGAIGLGIFGETEEHYYYFSTTYYSGAVNGYEKGSPLIVKAKKDEITQSGYHAEITY